MNFGCWFGAAGSGAAVSAAVEDGGAGVTPLAGAAAAPVPQPMLAKSGPIPTRGDSAFEVKWDGFRALVATVVPTRLPTHPQPRHEKIKRPRQLV